MRLGRPPSPRLSPEATRTALQALYLVSVEGSTAAGVLPRWWAGELAVILGVSRQQVHEALRRGVTVPVLQAWTGEVAGPGTGSVEV